MISKAYTKTGKKCRVTFKLDPTEVAEAKIITVLGDFNGWSPDATPLKPRKDGSFSTTESLESGKSYRFRYLVDGKKWLTDGDADGQVPNRFGEVDAVVEVAQARPS